MSKYNVTKTACKNVKVVKWSHGYLLTLIHLKIHSQKNCYTLKHSVGEGFTILTCAYILTKTKVKSIRTNNAKLEMQFTIAYCTWLGYK